jgi:hypothetical protein
MEAYVKATLTAAEFAKWQGAKITNYGAEIAKLKEMTVQQEAYNALIKESNSANDKSSPSYAFERNLGIAEAETDPTKRAAGIQAAIDIQQRALAEMDKNSQKATDSMSQMAEHAARSIKETLGSTLADALDGHYNKIGASFAAMIRKMLADAAAAKIMEAMFGSWGVKQPGGGVGSLGGYAGMLMGMFTGGDSGGLAGIGGDSSNWGSGGMLGGGRAGGGGVQAGSMYEVNEKGPEVLSVGGKDFLMMGSQGGQVKPNQGGGGIVYAPQISVDARTDQAAVSANVGVMLRENNRQLIELLRARGVM